mgnify:CR=1 FL=1
MVVVEMRGEEGRSSEVVGIKKMGRLGKKSLERECGSDSTGGDKVKDEDV